MHPLKKFIPKGLKSWKNMGAEIFELKKDRLSVRKVWIEPKKDNRVVALVTGLHLEETSGPYLLLKANRVKAVLKPALEKGIGLVIYPVVNQFGLGFSPNQGGKLMRYDKDKNNYNDGWGIPNARKCVEVSLVEQDILDICSRYKIILALSLHEDSETPKKGYIYTNKVNPADRNKITSQLKNNINKKFLATKEFLLDVGEETFQGGKIEEEFNIVDSQDHGSLENWLADDLKIPTILSEAPFSLPLPIRKKFHLEVIKGALSSLKNEY